MKVAAWVAVVLFFVAFVAAALQTPRAHQTYWAVFVAAGLVAFALAYALSVSHLTVT